MAEHRSPITSEIIGENMDVNPVVIRRTMAGLRDSGIVRSVKGHGGGWTIARNLKEISLLDIYRALDEPVLIQQHRYIENPDCLVEQTVGHILNQTFREAEEAIIKRFEKIKVSELYAKFHARAEGRELRSPANRA